MRADQQLGRARLCATLATAQLGFELQACGEDLPVPVPQSQRLGLEVCAATLEPVLLLMLERLLICSLHAAPLHVNLSWLAWRPGRVC
jgi:hypothetical protein